jgi:uncharacterized repeat protein (TIGR01451 family)
MVKSRSRGLSARAILCRVAVVLMAATPFAATASSARAGGPVFEKGDVFVGVANGQVQWYKPDGTLVSTLDNGVGGFTTGMAFDAAGHLYVTNFNAGTEAGTPFKPQPPQGAAGSVSEFDTDGTNLGLFGDGTGINTPESILFDQSGDAYIGNVGGAPGIIKLDGDGALLDSFESGRTDWIDLAADQCTMLFTDEGGTIHSYDVCTDEPLPDFGSGGDFALRFLPTGGVVVAALGNINRFDDSGNIIQSYDADGEDCWFALNLDPDGTSFWSADFCTSDFVRFDLATGDVLDTFNTGTGGSTVFGLTVFGEITVSSGSADLSVVKEDSPEELLVGQLLTYTITVTNGGPDTSKNVVVTDALPSSEDFQTVSTDTGSCSQKSGTVTCNLGDMDADATAVITITVIPTEEGSVTNTAVVSSDTGDPDLSNNSDSATTVVNPVPGGGVQTGAGGTAHQSTPVGFFVLMGLLIGAGVIGVRRLVRS